MYQSDPEHEMLTWLKKMNRSTLRCYLLLLCGGICSVSGGIATILFLREIDRGGRMPPGQVAARLILPHMALLTGLGMLLAGVIILKRNAILRERQRKEEDA